MLQRALILTLLLAAVTLSAAGAQAPVVELDRLSIALWPEYDRRAVLVIYRAELPPDVQLPAEVTLPIPTEAGPPHAVANAGQDGGLVNAEFETRVDGPWMLVSVRAESTSVWLEYYDDLSIDGEARRFGLEWPGTIAVGDMTYEVQEPIGAEQVEISPEPVARRQGADGLTYAQGELGRVPQGEQRAIEVTYSRAGQALTADLLGAPPAATGVPSPEGGPTPGWLPIAGRTLGLAALLAAIFFIWNRARAPRTRPSRRRRRASPPAAEARFCHQCGRPVAADDRFCRHCGTEQRR